MNVLAVEPATHGHMGRAEPGEPWIQPGETVTLHVSLSFSAR